MVPFIAYSHLQSDGGWNKNYSYPTHPWLFENEDPNHMAYKPSTKVVASGDGDGEVWGDKSS